MSDLEFQVVPFLGHSMTRATINGRPMLQSNDLASPLEITRRSVQRLVAALPESERCDVPCRTSSGTQMTSFVSQAGALEVCLSSRSPSRPEFIRWVVGLATGMAQTAPALPSPELAQLPARVDQLAARLSEEVEGLAQRLSDTHMVVSQQACTLSALQSRILRLETEKQATPRLKPRATYPIRDAVPEAEAANFFQKWRDWLGTHWREPNEVELMVHTHDLLPSLFAGTQLTVRGRQTRLGCWLGTRPEAERSRTSHRRYVRLVRAVAA